MTWQHMLDEYGPMRRAGGLAKVVAAVGVLACQACAGLVHPVGELRVTTEIHGNPPTGSAHVQNQRFFDYPFDGSVVKLFDVNIEVDDPPPGNHVQFVGTVTRLGRSGQRVRMSFFGPNAMDDIPSGDEPIFVDLFGSYTDSDNRAGPVTGPIDLFDIGGMLFWSGIDASSLFVDPDSVHVSIVDVDGGTTDIAFDEHPLRFSVVDVGDPNENLSVSLGLSVFFEPPWVPELVETADEVHFSFDVYLLGHADSSRTGVDHHAGRPIAGRRDDGPPWSDLQ